MAAITFPTDPDRLNYVSTPWVDDLGKSWTYEVAKNRWNPYLSAGGGSGTGGVTVQDEGVALATTATTLNFVGSGVTATGTGATKTITISSGGDALTSGTLDQFAGVTQTATKTLAITGSTTLAGGSHSGTNTGDQTLPTRDSLGLDTDDIPSFSGVTFLGTGIGKVILSAASSASIYNQSLPNADGTVALTSDLHTAATVSGDGITISGQQISLLIGTSDLDVAAGNHAHTGVYIPTTGGTMTNGTLAGTLAAGVLTTDATTKANLANAAGLGTGDSVTFDNVTAGVSFSGKNIIGNTDSILRVPGAFEAWNGEGLLIYASRCLVFSSSTSGFNPARDVGFARNAAGVIEVNSSSIGTFRDLKLRNLTASGIIYATGTIKTGSMTVATATASGSATAVAAGAGAMTYITDEAGGATPAFSDGTVWRRVSDRASIS